MEAACYIGMINQWYQLVVWTALEVAIAFAQVDVDLYRMLAGWHRESLV